MSQQYTFGSQSQPDPHRSSRRVPPISTALNSSKQLNTPADFSSRSPFPSTGSAFPSLPPSRQPLSRTSSASSTSSPFSPSQTGSQQPLHGSLLSSARSRNISSSNPSQSASSAAAVSHASNGGGGTGSSGGGGAFRLARSSPALSQTGTLPSPSSATQPGRSVENITVAQVFLLLNRLKAEGKDKSKWEGLVEQLRNLLENGGMEVFSKYFRRLVQSHAVQIGLSPPTRNVEQTGGDYALLAKEMQMITDNSQQAYKIAESLDTNEGDVFRDFDLSTFMDHFKLTPTAKTTLALAVKSAQKSDLRTKADAILSSIYPSFISSLRPANGAVDDLAPSFWGSLVERLLLNPPRSWTEDSRAELVHAVSQRYSMMQSGIPSEVASALYLVELLGPENPLVKKVQRTGPKTFASVDSAKEFLASVEVREIDYTQVASVLLYLVIAYNTYPETAGNFVAALREHRAGRQLEWIEVIASFDREKLRITKQQFLPLFRALVPLAKDDQGIDIQRMWGGDWQYSETQLSFAVAFLSCTPDEIDATQIPNLRAAFSLDMFEKGSDDVRTFAQNAIRHPLVSLDAVAVLFTMIFSSNQAYAYAQKLGIPELVINANTEIFMVSASAVRKPWKTLQDQALKQLYNPFWVKSLAHYDFVLHGLWKHDPTWVVQRIMEYNQIDPMSLDLIVEHALKHGWMDDLLRLSNELSLELAAFVHAGGLFDIDPWMQSMFDLHGQRFGGILASFLSTKCEHELVQQRDKTPPVQVALSIKTVQYLLERIEDQLQEDAHVALQRLCLQAYPRLINYGEGYDDIIHRNSEAGNALSPEADLQMQQHYKHMYAEQSEVRDIIELLRTYKRSQDPEEQELFVCMVHGLFDEYNCFGEYPVAALATTAVLFGGIIGFELLSKIALRCALAMILEGLTEPDPGGSMFKFGLQALLHFKNRLPEWPKYCERLASIPQLQGSDIWDEVQKVAGNTDDVAPNGDLSNGLSMPNGGNVDEFLDEEPVAPSFQCLHVEPPLRPELYEDPDEAVSDKVLFVLNNVSERNLKEKLKELQNVLEDKHHQWFANYLVEERAKMQPNFQKLYLEMLQLLDDRTLWAEVLRETFVSVIRMLNSESTQSNSTEKTHLKNLGGWLGSLTVARDYAIKYRNISFKDLLIEGFDTQRLVIVIPFTCKVLVKASESTVFKPPNPWLMEIIGLLVELYHFADLKLNLKFEIEVLCKDLDLDYKTIEPSSSIRSRPVHDDFEVASMLPDPMDGFSDLSLMGLNRPGRATGRFSPASITASLPDLRDSLVFPPHHGNTNTMRQNTVLFQAAQQAVTEIIAPVVERSVTIASISAAQLIQKDFSTEGDEEKFRNAAHKVVKSLSGSLALVTCKEPLRMSIMNNIRMLARDLPEQALPEGTILMFVNDNLDVVCNSIEQAAEAKSIAEIDSQIEGAVVARQLWRRDNPNEPYKDPAISNWAFYMPEPYKQSSGGLNADQFAIYEEFGRQARPTTAHGNNASQDSSRQVPDVLQDQFQAAPGLTPGEGPALPRQGLQQPPRHSSLPLQQPATQHLNGFFDHAEERLIGLIEELQRIARECPETRVAQLTPESPIHNIFDQISNLLKTPAAESLCMVAAQFIEQTLASSACGHLEVEVLVALFCSICHESVQTAKNILLRFTDLSINNKVISNAWALASLIREHLIDLSAVDQFIADKIRAREGNPLDYLTKILDDVVLEVPLEASRTNFALSLGAVHTWASDDPDLPEAQSVLSKLTADVDKAIPTDPAAHAEYLLLEWLGIQRDVPAFIVDTFVWQLHKQGLLVSTESTAIFLRACLDSAVTAYEAEEQNAIFNFDRAFVKIDGLANLVVALVVHQRGSNGAVQPPKVRYFSELLKTIGLLFIRHHHERGLAMKPKIFHRFFLTVIDGILAQRSVLEEIQTELFQQVGEVLLATTPHVLEGFSFSWLGIVGYGSFFPTMVASRSDKSWDIYARLIETMLLYTGKLARDVDTTEQCRAFHNAVVRILLVIHHDFPEFLAENHFRLVNAITGQCTQLRNLIVSAYPSSFPELPDPFTAGLKVDRMEEIRKPPTICDDIASELHESTRNTITRLIDGAEPQRSDLDSICSSVYLDASAKPQQVLLSDTVDVRRLTATVIYIASTALAAQGPKVAGFSPDSPATKLFEVMAMDLTPEARYHLINAMANQLRWPNSHTHYFSHMLIHLLAASSTEQKVLDVQQMAVRVLLERLLVHRPHPWGLIITLLEILKSHGPVFWNLPVVKSNAQVQQTFEMIVQQLQRSPRPMN